jgi:hypothetical protein
MTENFWEFFPGKFFRGIFLPETGARARRGHGRDGEGVLEFSPQTGPEAPPGGII